MNISHLLIITLFMQASNNQAEEKLLVKVPDVPVLMLMSRVWQEEASGINANEPHLH